jgi:hypothetical protein
LVQAFDGRGGYQPAVLKGLERGVVAPRWGEELWVLLEEAVVEVQLLEGCADD